MVANPTLSTPIWTDRAAWTPGFFVADALPGLNLKLSPLRLLFEGLLPLQNEAGLRPGADFAKNCTFCQRKQERQPSEYFCVGHCWIKFMQPLKNVKKKKKMFSDELLHLFTQDSQYYFLAHQFLLLNDLKKKKNSSEKSTPGIRPSITFCI